MLSASQRDHKIAWYKNGGGSPPAWTPYTISTTASGAMSVFAADVDNDGRVDGTWHCLRVDAAPSLRHAASSWLQLEVASTACFKKVVDLMPQWSSNLSTRCERVLWVEFLDSV